MKTNKAKKVITLKCIDNFLNFYRGSDGKTYRYTSSTDMFIDYEGNHHSRKNFVIL